MFHGEGILAVTKALLQSGVSYVGGYQGAPVSHLMDVLADAQGLLNELGCISRRIPVKQVRPRCSGLRSTTPSAERSPEIDGGDECRFGRPFQPRLGRSQRRRADRAGRGLRGRGEHNPRTEPCLRDEIPDLAPRPAAEPAPDCEDGGTRFRTFGAEQLAGDAGTPHPCLPCPWTFHLQGQP